MFGNIKARRFGLVIVKTSMKYVEILMGENR
jgi:hypothetical protein